MDLCLLHADKPLSKAYSLSPQGKLVKVPYPFVYEVTSNSIPVSDLPAFARLTQQAAKLGSCLLKGTLSRPLVSESRAGSTDPAALTEWVCLDVDGISGFADVDELLAALGLADTDYLLQWSASMNVEPGTGLRCHIFMLLDTPTSPYQLKIWLQGLNLQVSELARQLRLTSTGCALRWPLDVTTCQNDKLIYVAPPSFGPGLTDPFPGTARFELHDGKASAKLHLPSALLTKTAIRQMQDAAVATLREAEGLPKRRAVKYKFAGTVEYMTKPDTATATGVKTERGFVYFNLNGGDSWAYYHPEDNPTFIYNFKGEPVYKTEELLPAYWASLQERTRRCLPGTTGLIYLAFRDFQTSNYYNGIYDTSTDRLDLAMAKSESQLRQFMDQHGQVMGDFVPDWTLAWDPHSKLVVDPTNKILNTYQPSSFFLQERLPKAAAPPPLIHRLVDHVLGNEPDTTERFLNWLACIVQHRTRTGTAWVLQGVPGTGKGVLFHYVITPLLGGQNVVAKRMEELESEFTGFMENKFVAFIDEMESDKSLYRNGVTAKLKNLIVEPTISIRRMYTPAYMATNYSNMLFASNSSSPVEIQPGDRRFNVGGFQSSPIVLTAKDIDDTVPAELGKFFAYLAQRPADLALARVPLSTDARTTLMDISRTAIDSVSDAVLAGDISFFWDHLSTTRQLSPLQALRHQPYRDLVVAVITDPEEQGKLTRDELHVLFDWCVGGMPQSPNKFTSLLKHHRLYLGQVWKNNRNVRGLSVTWRMDDAWRQECLDEVRKGVV